jgi:hypothetical protein
VGGILGQKASPQNKINKNSKNKVLYMDHIFECLSQAGNKRYRRLEYENVSPNPFALNYATWLTHANVRASLFCVCFARVVAALSSSMLLSVGFVLFCFFSSV